MTSIIGAIITGLVIGALARLVMPGKQNIGCIMTTILGACGAALGSWVTNYLGYHNGGGFEWIPFFVGIACAVILIGMFLSVTGRKTSR